MLASLVDYAWIPGLAFIIWCVPRCERRAYGLVGAGLLSTSEAARLTRFLWFSVLAITVAVLTAQFTYAGGVGPCALFADPLRPGALMWWVVVEIVLVRAGSFAVTSAGRALLTRMWPALAISQPLSQVWRPRQVVPLLLSAWLAALFLGVMAWMAITRPGSVMRC